MSHPIIPSEACTGAVCAGCLQPGQDLKCCSKCKRAWYCSTDCQKAHWTKWGHKDACKSAAPALQSLQESIAKAQPSSYDEVEDILYQAGMAVQRTSDEWHQDVYNMVTSTAFCRVCFTTREQLPLEQRRQFRCCPDCLWGWCCCEDHWQQHKQQHGQHCRKCMAAGLSIPLTAVAACSHLYSSSQLQRLQEFTLHMVGSSQYEYGQVARTAVIEEVMHLLPAVKQLTVVLIGPGLAGIMRGASYLPPHDKPVCPPCEAAGCRRIQSMYAGPYEEFAGSPHWSSPTLALACNSGIGVEETEEWLRAVEVLLDRNVPCCFTSYEMTEANADAAALAAAGARIVHGPAPNPFRSLAPHLDSSIGPDKFYCLNAVMTCFKGSMDSSSSSSKGAAGKEAEQKQSF